MCKKCCAMQSARDSSRPFSAAKAGFQGGDCASMRRCPCVRMAGVKYLVCCTVTHALQQEAQRARSSNSPFSAAKADFQGDRARCVRRCPHERVRDVIRVCASMRISPHIHVATAVSPQTLVDL